MSLDSVLVETTPKDDVSPPPVSQSNLDKQDFALTLNPSNSCLNTSVVSMASITSNSSNDMNASNVSEEVSKEGDSQKDETKVETSVLKEEQSKRPRRHRRARKRKSNRVDHRSNKRFQWSECSEQEVRRLHRNCVEHGQPLAPYNTTQFIMNEHNADKEIDFDELRGKIQRMKRTEHNHQRADPNDPNEEDFYSSPEDESDYLQQQFHETYDNIHAERLSAMTKNELVQEYLQLEDRVEDLEKRLKESSNQINTETDDPLIKTKSHSEVQTEQCSSDGHSSGTQVVQQITTDSDVFQQEIKRLSEENQRLRCDNEKLKSILSQQNITTDPQK